MGSVDRFVNEIQIGDRVMVFGWREFYIGEIKSDYRFQRGGSSECPYVHRRDVTWTKKIEASKIPSGLKKQFYTIMTVSSLDGFHEEIEELGEAPPSLERVRNQCWKIVQDKDGQSFERLCGRILESMGFWDVEIEGGPGDHGVDIRAQFPILGKKIRFGSNIGGNK